MKLGASIGANATIVCGNDIGEYAFVGAGAVVTKTVEPYALVVGNPAIQIGWISEYGIPPPISMTPAIAVCAESGDKYELKNESVRKI